MLGVITPVKGGNVTEEAGNQSGLNAKFRRHGDT